MLSGHFIEELGRGARLGAAFVHVRKRLGDGLVVLVGRRAVFRRGSSSGGAARGGFAQGGHGEGLPLGFGRGGNLRGKVTR